VYDVGVDRDDKGVYEQVRAVDRECTTTTDDEDAMLCYYNKLSKTLIDFNFNCLRSLTSWRDDLRSWTDSVGRGQFSHSRMLLPVSKYLTRLSLPVPMEPLIELEWVLYCVHGIKARRDAGRPC